MRIRSGEGWGQLPRRISLALSGAKLNGCEFRVVWAIVHKTIAFNRSEDKIPGSQLVGLTGINKRHLKRTVNSLLKKGVIFRKDNVYGIQRDFTKWEMVPNQVLTEGKVPNRVEMVPNRVEMVPNRADSRDLSKRTIQEKGLSASLGKEDREKFLENYRKMVESIGKVPGK